MRKFYKHPVDTSIVDEKPPEGPFTYGPFETVSPHGFYIFVIRGEDGRPLRAGVVFEQGENTIGEAYASEGEAWEALENMRLFDD